MKAAVYTKYGPPEVLHITEVATPVPKPQEILIKVKATSVNSADWRLRKADPFMVRLFFGLFKPKKNILGVTFSGIVEETGNEVTLFKKGDPVFGLSDRELGACAEYLCLNENTAIALKPKNISFAEAACIPFGAHTALFFLNKAKVQKGDKVLVYGASGAVGTAAIQLAKFYQAHVTAVCSTANLALVKSLGATKVIDYTKEEISQITERFDLIFETVNKLSPAKAARLLNPQGVLILGAAMIKEMFGGLYILLTKKHKVIMGEAKATAEDMNFLKELVQQKKLKPVIDKTYPLEKIVEAHQYVEKGHKKGNVAVLI